MAGLIPQIITTNKAQKIAEIFIDKSLLDV